jgi:Xaa-Pro aminopeptidase
MTDVVMYADPLRSPDLRHEVPLASPDPVVYVERDGLRQVFLGSLDVPLLEGVDGLQARPVEDLGNDELVAAGLPERERERELVLRACRLSGVERALVPAAFPLAVADHLRANGVELEPDGGFFDARRRAKNDAELAGIRRAVRASELALARIRELLASGEPQTSEGLRTEVMRVFTEAGIASPDPPIISHGAQTAIGHEPGHGEILAGEPVVCDLYPMDPESGCYSDMTRTFCVGEPPAELVEYWELCREALDRVLAEIRPGASGRELYRIAAEVFSAAGHPTQLTKEPGVVLDRGFFHSLGHGVGLEVHEAPSLGRIGEELVAADVIAVEPGCYRPGFGGCRLEELVLVTEDGAEVLTTFPHDLRV